MTTADLPPLTEAPRPPTGSRIELYLANLILAA